MSDAETIHLRQVVQSLVMSNSAQKIDFWIGSIHVDGNGFASVQFALTKQAAGYGSMTIEIGGVAKGADLSYNIDDNAFHFPHARYGATDKEQMLIIHECVHAMLDIAAGTPLPLGAVPITKSENEAAAYIAGCLFWIYEHGGPDTPTPEHVIWIKAFEIADKIKNVKGAHVSAVDALSLRGLISVHPVYVGLGVGLLYPLDNANGVP